MSSPYTPPPVSRNNVMARIKVKGGSTSWGNDEHRELNRERKQVWLDELQHLTNLQTGEDGMLRQIVLSLIDYLKEELEPAQ